MQATWRKQQQQALAALNIPVFQLRKPAAVGNQHVATKATATETPVQRHCYRVGPIYIVSSTPLPVEIPRWLADFCLIWDSRPVAVKAPAAEVLTVTIDDYLQHGLNEKDKRQLWQQLWQDD